MQKYFSALILLTSAAAAQTYLIDTIAGGGPPLGTPALSAPVYATCLTADAQGNTYVCLQNQILVFNSSGILTRRIGNGGGGFSGDGGPASNAQLNNPSGIALDSSGNLFIADTGNFCIRMVSQQTGVITTAATTFLPGPPPLQDFPPTQVLVDQAGNLFIAAGNLLKVAGGSKTVVNIPGLRHLQSMALGPGGDLYIADSTGYVIYRVSASDGASTVIAGTGQRAFGGDGGKATSTPLADLLGIAVDPAGNVYFGERDQASARVRRIDARTGLVSTVAGDPTRIGPSGDGGQATLAVIGQPITLSIDHAGNLLIGDGAAVRKIDQTTGIIQTVIGLGKDPDTGIGGAATDAWLNNPQAVAVDSNGDLYVGDFAGLHKISAATGLLTDIPLNPSWSVSDAGAPPQFFGIQGLVLDGHGSAYLVAYPSVLKVNLATGNVTPITGAGGLTSDCGNAWANFLGFIALAVALDGNGNLYISHVFGICEIDVAGHATTLTTIHQVQPSYGIAADPAGNVFFFSHDGSAPQIQRIDAVTRAISSVAIGDGSWLTTDGHGTLYWTDNNVISRFLMATGMTDVLAAGPASAPLGDGGPALGAHLSDARQLAVDPLGNIYVADRNNARIRKLSISPLSTTAAPSAGGTVQATPPVFNNLYTPGSIATVTAVPNPGYAFAGWSGDLTGAQNPQSITMDRAHSVTAQFTQGGIGANHGALNFAVRAGKITPAQTIAINAAPGVAWQASASATNIQVTPASGTGPAILTVSVTGGPSGSVNVTSNGFQPLAITVNVRVLPASSGANPSNLTGFIDQPGASQTTGFSGAIPITGWALDDVGVGRSRSTAIPFRRTTPSLSFT